MNNLGQDLLLTMSDYIQFSIESDYEAALKFFKVFGDKMESVNPVPVVKFFFYIHGQVSFMQSHNNALVYFHNCASSFKRETKSIGRKVLLC